MRRSTVELDEGRAATLRLAIEAEPRLVGVLGALSGKRIVGVTVEEPAPAVNPDVDPSAPATVAEVTPPAKPRRGRK